MDRGLVCLISIVNVFVISVFGWGSLVVFIICLGTLPGGLLAPLMDKAVYRYVLAGMMGLAVGSLLGDGVLHVIPDVSADVTNSLVMS